MIFDSRDYDILHALVFRGDFPGYRPDQVELPNGDGVADVGKRYAHVSVRTLAKYEGAANDSALLWAYLATAHARAREIAIELGISPEWRPRLEHGALRVLEYAPSGGSALHTDFDLFTVACFRGNEGEISGPHGFPLTRLRSLPDLAAFGELYEIYKPGVRATKHQVLPCAKRQISIVYFAIPDHKLRLSPRALDVREWLEERLKRSRASYA